MKVCNLPSLLLAAPTKTPLATRLVGRAAALMIAVVGGRAPAQEPAGAGAKPFLHPLFSENAVLQRDRPLPIWGWTQPQGTVVVRLDAAVQTVRADAEGRWTVSIAPHAAGGPHALSVKGPREGESATRGNLVFGDVWLCGGQSNMAYDLHGVNNSEAEIAAADYPDLRLLQVPNAITNAPLPTFEKAAWQVCTPRTVPTFSGVGYFFGRQLHGELKVPIGLIDSSWSGTPGQAWVSGPALAAMPEFKPAVDALKAGPNAAETFAGQILAWWRNDPGTGAHQEAPAFDDAAWQTMNLPAYWEDEGFPDFDGVMWLRRAVDVPASWAGRDLQLLLGGIDDNDTTYWNGTPVGATEGFSRARDYTVSGAQVKAGRNVIAIRVLDTGNPGGFSGPALSMRSGAEALPLTGAWKVRPGPALRSLPAPPRRLENPNAPVVLFNGKIAPLLPGEIKGVIWYQGESNADTLAQAEQYRTLLPILVNDWRTHFGAALPFYIVQLANFKAPDETPGDDAWPRLREAQLQTSQRLPNTGLVVTIDLGEEKDVHFHNKQAAAWRLALSALNRTYGVAVESSGPTLREAKAVEGAMQLSFEHAEGLNLRGDAGRVFAVAGADRSFHWATPQIAGNVVTIRSAEVPAPVCARFAWSNNPRASLYNGAGLPASPFQYPPTR